MRDQMISKLREEKLKVQEELHSKNSVIEELELEIEDFTANVEENMIKIDDHEDIVNREIKNLQQQHTLQFEMFQGTN